MKSLSTLSLLLLMISLNTAWAYGGGGSSSSKACAKPKFTEFIPGDKAEVDANSEFSFIASSNTYPESIKVTVKKIPVELTIEDKKGTAFKVSGVLPADLKGTYARISITADAPSDCRGTGGWLVKVR